jgi:hypothetical protein
MRDLEEEAPVLTHYCISNNVTSTLSRQMLDQSSTNEGGDGIGDRTRSSPSVEYRH